MPDSSQGVYKPELHHFAIRYGLVIPVALVYRLFGIREWTTIVMPLLASSAAIPLLALITSKLFGPRAGLIAGALYATLPIHLRYATILVPEPVAEFYVLVGVIAYLHIQNKFYKGLFAGICIGIAYLTKEPALFIGPALMIDSGLRRQWWTALGVATGCIGIVATEHAYYLATTGDLLFRSHSMVIHEQSEAVLDCLRNIPYRLFKAYPRMMLVPNVDFGIHSLFCLILAAPAILRDAGKTRFLVLWALLPWLYINFGDSNFGRFVPLPIVPRYIDFFYPPLIVLCTGNSLDQIVTMGSLRATLSILMLMVVCSIGLSCGRATSGRGYHTDEVTALRLIARKAEEYHIRSIRFEQDQDGRWAQTMAILSPSLRVVTSSDAEIKVMPGAFGLPTVMGVPISVGGRDKALTHPVWPSATEASGHMP